MNADLKKQKTYFGQKNWLDIYESIYCCEVKMLMCEVFFYVPRCEKIATISHLNLSVQLHRILKFWILQVKLF